jgi:hypothetical protein
MIKCIAIFAISFFGLTIFTGCVTVYTSEPKGPVVTQYGIAVTKVRGMRGPIDYAVFSRESASSKPRTSMPDGRPMDRDQESWLAEVVQVEFTAAGFEPRRVEADALSATASRAILVKLSNLQQFGHGSGLYRVGVTLQALAVRDGIQIQGGPFQGITRPKLTWSRSPDDMWREAMQDAISQLTEWTAKQFPAEKPS